MSVSLAFLALASACAGDVADTGEAAPGDASEARIDPDVTFYVIGYHWGWAVFDEGGNELDGIRVPQGTNVEVFAANAHATEAIDRFPVSVATAIKSIEWAGERTLLEIAEGRLPDPQQLIGMKLEDVLGHDDHGDDHADADEHADSDDHADDADAHADSDDHADDADEHADSDDHSDDADDHADDADDHADDADDHADDADDHADDADDHADDADDHADDADQHADDADAHADDADDRNLVGHAMAAWEMPWVGEERELETHGFLIPWHGVTAKLEPDAAEPFHAVFSTDRPGAFRFECVVYCGFGHRYQQREMLFVTAAQ